jgi:hypothetical protein
MHLRKELVKGKSDPGLDQDELCDNFLERTDGNRA